MKREHHPARVVPPEIHHVHTPNNKPKATGLGLVLLF